MNTKLAGTVFILLFFVSINVNYVNYVYAADSSGTATVVSSTGSIGWFDTQKPMVTDYAYVDVNLTNFPVFVHLDGSIVDWTNIQDDLDDIRFVGSDNLTFLDYEIEDYVVNDEAWFWVLMPEVDSGCYTPFWLYYGNTTISAG